LAESVLETSNPLRATLTASIVDCGVFVMVVTNLLATSCVTVTVVTLPWISSDSRTETTLPLKLVS